MSRLPERAPLVIRGAQVVSMDAERSVFRADVLVEDGAIARIERIAKKGATRSSLRAPRGVRVLEAQGSALIPGLVQSHVHLCQVLFRNQADGLELLDWLQERIWPFEAAHDARSLRFSARLGIAELLLSGTTSILDMATVRHSEEVFRAAEESGIRYSGGKCLMDQGYPGLREETAAAMREAEALGNRWHANDSGRIQYALCPRFVLSCSEPLWNSVRDLSAKRGWVVHTHASENRTEVKQIREAIGDDNVAWFHQIGLGSPRLVLAHCVHLSAREMRMMAKSGASAVHCPGANLKLASGIAPIPQLLALGINVALGADGAPCNNTLDALREMRLAATLHLPRFGPRSMPASEVLAMATIHGARALGLERETGSIEPGKRADLALVDLSGVHFAPPAPDLHATLVYCAQQSDITEVIVDGRHLVKARQLVSLDARALARAAPQELSRLQKRLPADLVRRSSSSESREQENS